MAEDRGEGPPVVQSGGKSKNEESSDTVRSQVETQGKDNAEQTALENVNMLGNLNVSKNKQTEKVNEENKKKTSKRGRPRKDENIKHTEKSKEDLRDFWGNKSENKVQKCGQENLKSTNINEKEGIGGLNDETQDDTDGEENTEINDVDSDLERTVIETDEGKKNQENATNIDRHITTEGNETSEKTWFEEKWEEKMIEIKMTIRKEFKNGFSEMDKENKLRKDREINKDRERIIVLEDQLEQMTLENNRIQEAMKKKETENRILREEAREMKIMLNRRLEEIKDSSDRIEEYEGMMIKQRDRETQLMSEIVELEEQKKRLTFNKKKQ